MPIKIVTVTILGTLGHTSDHRTPTREEKRGAECLAAAAALMLVKA
jgi:hypothetical protein